MNPQKLIDLFCTTHERNETEGNTKTSSQLLAMEQVLDNEFKYGKQADERIHVLNTNSNSPSLVIKEQSQNDSKAEEETVQNRVKKTNPNTEKTLRKIKMH